MATAHSPQGLDLGRFGNWFDQAVHGAAGSLSARLIAGGRSNLTYQVSGQAGSWIVRRPPLGHVLATAHDMSREYRVMSALAATEVPVPATYAFCDDTSVVGAPFYVMENVAGSPYRYASELAPLGPQRTRTIAARLTDTLVALHDVAPAAVGLTDFGRPEGFLGRQVKRWKKQLDASYSRDLPPAAELHGRLAANIPPESAPGIVHGDYRLDNVLIDVHDRPAAVVDWEMATLGDPLTDLALLVLYRRLGSQLPDNVVATAAAAPGFLTESEILNAYDARSQRAVSSFGFHLGLASFKLATIFEGIHYRYLHGQTVGSGFEDIGTLTEPVLDIGLRALRDYD
jgi:aminoglycoside phosphotransferase (APT) family kinase protein